MQRSITGDRQRMPDDRQLDPGGVAGRSPRDVRGLQDQTGPPALQPSSRQAASMEQATPITPPGRSMPGAASISSTSRLRYTNSSNASARNSSSAPPPPPEGRYVWVEQTATQSPDEGDVQVAHIETDEWKREVQVEEGMLQEVDKLAAAMSQQRDEYEAQISEMEVVLQRKDEQLTQAQQEVTWLRAHHQGMPQRPWAADLRQAQLSVWMSLLTAYHARRRCWWISAGLVAAVLLIALLAATLTKHQLPAPPQFSYVPVPLALGSSVINLQLAVTEAAVVHYVLLPLNSSDRQQQQQLRLLDGISAHSVVLAASGRGDAALEAGAQACGQLAAPREGVNYTLSITTEAAGSLECQQRAAAAAAGAHAPSCWRCPQVAPASNYTLLVVPQGPNGATGRPAAVPVSTLGVWTAVAPVLLGNPSVTAAGETALSLTFSVDRAGQVHYLVLYQTLYARFMDMYVVFDNQVEKPEALLSAPLATSQHGLMARGTIRELQPNTPYTCTIDGAAAGASVCCTPAAACEAVAGCFGGLCAASSSSLAPNTTYKVVLLAQSEDGSVFGAATKLDAVTTFPAQRPPQPTPGLQVSPVVGPDRFAIQGIGQDKPGFVYLIVTRPRNQALSDVLAGAATPFAKTPVARLSSRRLLQSSPVPLILPQVEPQAFGDPFLPPCNQPVQCETAAAVADWTQNGTEAVVSALCLPVTNIAALYNKSQTGLANNTLYRVRIVPTDLSDNQDLYAAMVRTQDLTPPVLTVVDTPPPGLEDFTVVVTLDEPGVLFAAWYRADVDGAVVRNATCPPSFQGTNRAVMGQVELTVTAANHNATISAQQGLTSNTAYVLYLIARDTVDNCQRNFTAVLVQTADNTPPVLAATVSLPPKPLGGTQAALRLQLDEPGTVQYLVMQAGGPACPQPQQMFPPGPLVPAGATVPLGGFGSVLVSARASNVGTVDLANLTSQTAYTVCLVAEDLWHNRIVSVVSVGFTTLDITPPTLAVAVQPGADSQVSCDRRTTMTCTVAFTTTINEPGVVSWLLLPARWASVPAPDASTLLAQVPVPGTTATGNTSAVSAGITVPVLPTDPADSLAYTLLAAAADASGNVQPAVAAVTITVPDVTPPTFVAPPVLASATDLSLGVIVQLTESSTVAFVPLRTGAAVPSAAQVLAGVDAANARVAAAGIMPPTTGNATAILTAAGLVLGTLYDVHMVARDVAGNSQRSVTSLLRVRTTDHTAPVIAALVATFTPPLNFTVTATVSKPGTLRFIALKPGSPAPASADEVLQAVATNSGANFTSSFAVPEAGSLASSGTLCVADGAGMEVHAVAQDNEGTWPGGVPNNSTVASTLVVLINPSSQACPLAEAFLSPMRTRLVFDLSGPGLPVGAVTSSVGAATQAVTLTQAASAFMRQPPGSATARVVAGGMTLAGQLDIDVRPFQPAAIAVLVRSYVLVQESNSQQGQTLQLSYQLTDAASRTQVDVRGVAVQVWVAFTSGAPAGVPPSGAALGTCHAAAVDAVSGVADCALVVEDRFFPASGRAHATVQLRVTAGGRQLAASPLAPLQLWPPPTIATFAPPAPGLLVILPYRPVCVGEVIKVSVVANNPTQRGLTGFIVPLQYNANYLQFQGASAASLWLTPQPPVQTGLAGSWIAQTVQVTARAPNQNANQYRASAAIPLLDFHFLVLGAASIPLVSVYSRPLGGGGAVPNAALSPSTGVPAVQVNDHRGGAQSAGALNITGVPPLVGIFAWTPKPELFNTAQLNGADVTMPILAQGVPAFGQRTTLGSGVSCVAQGATPFVLNGCNMVLHASSTGTAKGVRVRVVYSPTLHAQVTVSVWATTNVRLVPDFPVLRSVLPVNANLSQRQPGCKGWYQSTRVAVLADWTNGDPLDVIRATEVTALASGVASNDTAAAMVVQGTFVQGVEVPASVQQVAVRVSLAGSAIAPAPSVVLTVSNTPVCLTSLVPLAATGAEVTANNSVSGLVPSSAAMLTWQLKQRLVWEQDQAPVGVWATFADGSAADVSQSPGTNLRAVAAGGVAPPFSVSLDVNTNVNTLVVASQVGDPPTCGPFLDTTWSVCSIPIGSGTGTVSVRVPRPTAVSSFTVAPSTVAAAANPASQPPISLPVTAAAAVRVAFADGTDRDFSSDPRTVVWVAAGGALCQAARGPGGVWTVAVRAGAWQLFGACQVQANVTFATATLTSQAATVVVVAAQATLVYALPENAIALPSTDSNAVAGYLQPPHVPLTLLKCDWRSFEAKTVWALEQLSDCTPGGGGSCALADINKYVTLNTSDPSVAAVMSGYPLQSGYPTYPDKGNRLVPFAAGRTTLTVGFGGPSYSVDIDVRVQDTYQEGWPRVDSFADTPQGSAGIRIAANMTRPSYTVYALVVPSDQLDLAADPPSATRVKAGGGVALAADPALGPAFLSHTATGLSPATQYTVLLAVEAGATLGSGVVAVTGVAVPDTYPPNFQRVQVTQVTTDTASGRFQALIDLATNEPAFVSYALYGDPSCIASDPTLSEIRAGVALDAAGKCACAAAYCAPAHTQRPGNLSAAPAAAAAGVLPVVGLLPPSPYEPLRSALAAPDTQLFCRSFMPQTYASRRYTLYLVAEDDYPTYKGWTSTCEAPTGVHQSTPPGPCVAPALAPCASTPPPSAANNVQAMGQGFHVISDLTAAPAAIPMAKPVKGMFSLSDPNPMAFTMAKPSITRAGVTLVFSFSLNKPGLVAYHLAVAGPVSVAWGVYPVFDSSRSYNVTISRQSSPAGQLVPGTNYALFYNATDNYNSSVAYGVQEFRL